LVVASSQYQHGKPLSRGERQAAAGARPSQVPERSDRWLAEVCGLSHSTVAEYAGRRRAGPGRDGRDGRRRPVDPSGRAAIAKALAEEPRSSSDRRPKPPACAVHGPPNCYGGPQVGAGLPSVPGRLRCAPAEDIGTASRGCPVGPHLRSCRRAEAKGPNLLGTGRRVREARPGCRQVRSASEPSGLRGDHAVEAITEAREASEEVSEAVRRPFDARLSGARRVGTAHELAVQRRSSVDGALVGDGADAGATEVAPAP